MLIFGENMRNELWAWCRRRTPEGQILAGWQLAVRAVLFPLDFFYWRMSMTRGYRWQDDTWLIHGVRFSSESLRRLSKNDGRLLKVVCRDGELVTIEQHNAKLSGAEGVRS